MPYATITVPTGCVFREAVVVTKPLTLDGGGKAEIRGSDIWKNWAKSGNYWLQGVVPYLSVHGECATGTSACLWPEQVFFDGKPLKQVVTNPIFGQFAVNSNRQILLADNPTGHVVEVTTRRHWISTQSDNVTIQGFIFKHAANDSQSGALSVKNSHVFVRSNRMSDAHGAVISSVNNKNTQIINNHISRGGQLGIHGYNISNAVIQYNSIYDNNTEQFNAGWEAGGVKTATIQNTLFANNTVYLNRGPGLWCDINCSGVTYQNNRVHHNTGNGIFFEISTNGTIIGNQVWENGWADTSWGWGAGILVSSSSTTEVAYNTVSWNGDGISVVSQNRGNSTWNTVVGNSVHHNNIISTGNGPKALGWYQDWAGVLYNASSNNKGYDNKYWYPDEEGTYDRFEWNKTPIKMISTFNQTLAEEKGRYLLIGEKDTVLKTLGISSR